MKTLHSIIFLCLSLISLAQTPFNDFNPINDTIVINEVTVTGLTGTTSLKINPIPVTLIAPEAIQRTTSSNIIDAIAQWPGLSQITTGNGISKPVIRGLGYNRVLVINDGVRQEGQQWGDEHGVEIDAASIHSVEVIKGPASLMYGSDAMAGVVIFHKAPILPQGTMKLDIMGENYSNADLWHYSVDFAGNRNGFVWDGRWSQKQAGEYSNTKNGRVHNSQFSEEALNTMLGLNKKWGHSHLNLSYYHLKPGIVEGEEEESPFQQIHHYKAVSNNLFFIGRGSLKLLLGYQHNRRQEYEVPNECGLDFMLQTESYELRYNAPQWHGFTFNTGLNGMWQQSDNKGREFLIPAYHLFDIGFFVTASKDFTSWLHLIGGLRYDLRQLHSFALIDDDMERFHDFERSFNGISGSVGIVFNIMPQLDLRLNAARGFRAPNLSELGSNGEHEGTMRYEIGNPDLKPEFSNQFDLGIDYNNNLISAKIALFHNSVSNFIFLEKNGNVIDGKPVFYYLQGNTRLIGGEASLDLHPWRQLHFENSFSYVDAQQLNQPDESKYLPFTPAPRWLSSLRYEFKIPISVMQNVFVEMQMDHNFAQNNVHTANDTETTSPEYTLWNASAGADFYHNGRKILVMQLTAQNIFDCAYQNHLNRLRENGIYNMGRNIGIKINVPVTW